MANRTLTYSETLLLNAGRLRTANTSQGDMWATMIDAMSATAYNQKADTFNTLQTAVTAWLGAGDTVTGTNEQGNPQSIGTDPNHPLITHKPSS